MRANDAANAEAAALGAQQQQLENQSAADNSGQPERRPGAKRQRHVSRLRVSDEAIPAATLIVVREAAGRAAAADGRARRRHGVCRRRAGLSRRPDRPGGPRARRATWASTQPRSRRSARPIEETALPVGLAPLPTPKPRSSFSASWSPTGLRRAARARRLEARCRRRSRRSRAGCRSFMRCAGSTPCSSSPHARRANGSRASSKANARAPHG